MSRPNESGWKIPQDWDGTGWTCYQIQWPDSEEYTLLLRGLLYSLTRGRDWDQATGTITAAQLIAWLIWDKNIPLVNCQDCPPEAQDGQSEPCGGILVEESTDMGQVVTDVTVVDGKLTVWFGPCCSKELTGFLAKGDNGVGDDPLNPDSDPAFVYSACGKATAIVEAVYQTIEASFAAVQSSAIFPWQLIHYVENAVGYDLDNLWLSMLIANAAAGWAIGKSFSDVANDVEKQQVICELVDFFGDDAIGVPDSATFEQIKGVFKANVSFVYWQLYDQAINAIGTTDMDTIAKLGAGDTAAVCDCPDQGLTVNDPTGNWGGTTWSHFYDFTQEAAPAWATVGADSHRDTGKGYYWYPNQISGGVQKTITFPFDPETGTITHVWLMLWLPDAFAYNVANMGLDTDATEYLRPDGAGWMDTQPTSQGGVIIAALYNLADALGGADNSLNIHIEGNTPEPWDQTAERSAWVMAMAVGGTGTDPFGNH